MDSIPIVVLTGQVPTFMIGNDAFQEADTVGITRPCTKHNWLVKDTAKLAETIHQAFHVATHGRPGPVLVDIPKDVQFATAAYTRARGGARPRTTSRRPAATPTPSSPPSRRWRRPSARSSIPAAASSTPAARPRRLLRELADETGFPLTSTLMGLGAYPASGKGWIGMLGMHGTYEANWAMHDCDVMLCIGARFDDRITGRTDAFSPHSFKVHVDIDPSSINKNIHVHVPVVGDVASVLADMLALWKERGSKTRSEAVAKWWKQIELWRGRNCLAFRNSDKVIKPQYALQRLEALTRGRTTATSPPRSASTRCGRRSTCGFEDPHRWMTSGGLGTMGYGFPASIGVQIAHPDALVINVAGEASWLMNMQEMGTAVQYRLPVKQFILNNERLGMVRQWQELLHGERYSSSWSEALPDFVKLADAFGAKGILLTDPAKIDEAITEMIEHPGPVIVDCVVEKHENCFPMIPSGKAHNEMLLGEDATSGRDRRQRRGPGLRGRRCCAPPSSSTRRSSWTSRRASRGRSISSPRPPTRVPGSWSSPRPGCRATRPGSGGCAPARTWPWRTTCTAPSPRTPSTSAGMACARSATSPATAASSSSPG